MMASAFGALVLGIITFSVPGRDAMAAGNRCAGDKIKAAGKKTDCLLALQSREARTGDPPAPFRVQVCKDRMGQAFLKAEDRPPCLTIGDAALIESKVDALVDDVDGELSLGTPNRCQSVKIKAAGRKAKCLLAAYSTAVRKGTVPVASKLQRCRDKMLEASLRAEARPPCETTSDANAIEGKVDSFTDDVAVEVTPPTTTSTMLPSTTTSFVTSTTTSTTICDCCSALPSLLSFATVAPGGVPTGQVLPGHCAQGTNNGVACTTDASCTGGGVCRGHLDRGALYYGSGQPAGVNLPASVPDVAKSYFKVATCDGLGNPNLTPASTADVPAGCVTPSGTPSYGQRHCTSAGCLVGPPVPIPNFSNPSTSTCAINVIDDQPGAATGTATCGSGAITINFPWLKHLYLTGGILGTQACALCTGGTVGVCGSGTCVGGTRNGTACTPETNALTSHDCPPPSGTYIADVRIVSTATTGTQTIHSFSTGAQPRVFCGYCFDANVDSEYANPPDPCVSDAECAARGDNFDTCRQHNNGAFRNPFVTTITETGSSDGECMANGATHATTLVSIFCIPPPFDPIIGPSAELPGPGAISLPGMAQLIP